MHTEAIQARINAMPALMAAKGLRGPDAEMDIRANAEPRVMLRWAKDTPYGNTEYKFLDAKTPTAVLAAAEAYIAALPSIDETRRANFQTALGKVIDLGRETGVEVDYVNPLVETMKRISENAIIDQRKAA